MCMRARARMPMCTRVHAHASTVCADVAYVPVAAERAAVGGAPFGALGCTSRIARVSVVGRRHEVVWVQPSRPQVARRHGPRATIGQGCTLYPTIGQGCTLYRVRAGRGAIWRRRGGVISGRVDRRVWRRRGGGGRTVRGFVRGTVRGFVRGTRGEGRESLCEVVGACARAYTHVHVHTCMYTQACTQRPSRTCEAVGACACAYACEHGMCIKALAYLRSGGGVRWRGGGRSSRTPR